MQLFNDEREEECLELLKAVSPEYPFDKEKDIEMLGLIREQFPMVDLAEELKQWRVWVLDNPPKTKGKGKWNWRARFRTWVKNSEQYGRGTGGRSDAANAAAFGSTRATEKW